MRAAEDITGKIFRQKTNHIFSILLEKGEEITTLLLTQLKIIIQIKITIPTMNTIKTGIENG